MIVDILILIVTIGITCFLGMVVVAALYGAVAVFLTFMSLGPQGVRKIWGKQGRD